MASDVERLRRDVSLSDVAAGFGLKLQRDGGEYVACCPFHSEDTPSFTLFTGKDHVERFHCFGCGQRGDVLDFVQAIKGVDLKEAIKILGGGDTSRPNIAPKKIQVRDAYEDIVPLDPPTDDIEPGKRVKLYNPKRAGSEREWGSFAPSMVFPYRRDDGSLIGYVLRHDLPGGDKETPMVMWVRLPNGDECWCRYPFPKPRALYGLDRLGDSVLVIVVEGEKCRDALRKATGRTVVSWPGGTQGVKHCDWSPLAGRNVVIWPDADAPGIETASEIAEIVHGMNATARVLDIAGEVA
jgi:DNA primase